MLAEKSNFNNQLFNNDISTEINRVVNAVLEDYKNISSSGVVKLLDTSRKENLPTHTFSTGSRELMEVIEESIHKIFDHRVRNNHPLFLGFIPGPASPLAWIGDIMATGFNIHAGSWLQSSGYSFIEMKLVEWLCQQIGLPGSAGGLFVSGGSMANLSGLTLARDQKLTPGERLYGIAYVSAQTHSSVAKALRIIGLLPHQIKKIPTNDLFQMDIELLERQIISDKRGGLQPFVIVASAGTTNTGSIDDLYRIAEICKRDDLWMHVDGAYGASVALSKKYKQLLNGIELADSISWDPHKWLFQTYCCSVLLVRDKKHLYESFHANPEYLKDAVVDEEQINFWNLGPELTRPGRAFKLWFTLQVAGTAAISDAISHGIEMANFIETELRKDRQWEIVSPANLAIINFRYFDDRFDIEELNKINSSIAQWAMKEGKVGVLTTRLNDLTILRVCTIHPEATKTQMSYMIDLLKIYSKKIVKEYSVGRPAEVLI